MDEAIMRFGCSIFEFVTLIVFLFSSVAFGDSVSHFGQGIGSDVPALLSAVGIGSTNSASETEESTFTLPGSSADVIDLTFQLERDTGSFQFEFGFYDVTTVTADPVTSQRLFATQALTSSTTVFQDLSQGVGATNTVSIAGGTQLGFFIVPNDSIVNVLANVDSFYDPPANSGPIFLNNRSSLFSTPEANPGQLDQMLSFVGNGITLFTFEDLTRIPGGRSDDDFTDLAFTIDAELIPGDVQDGSSNGGGQDSGGGDQGNGQGAVPEPSSIVVWVLLITLPFFHRRLTS